MIKIKCLSGKFQSVERCFIGTRVVLSWNPIRLGEEVSPNGLLSGFLRHQDAWQVDYSQATPEEGHVWFLADFVARIHRALTNGFSVSFIDYKWSWDKDGEALLTVLQNIEDVIVASGFNFFIESDDKDGLVIGVRGLSEGSENKAISISDFLFSPQAQAMINEVIARTRKALQMMGRKEEPELWCEFENESLQVHFKILSSEGHAVGKLDIPVGHWQRYYKKEE